MASEEIETALKEILPFLKWHSPFDYKKEVLEHLLGMTGTSDGLISLSKNFELMKSLGLLVIEDKSRDIKEGALKILVNTSTATLNKEILKELLNEDYLETLLSLLVDKNFPASNYCAMLLANLTKESKECETVYEFIKKTVTVSMESLLNMFCDVKYNEHCELHHVGSFMANLTLLKDARLRLLDKEKKLILKLLPFTQFVESSVRRYSVAAVIKNCLFETDYHEWLISDDVELLTFLLLPLAGPEEFTSDENEELLLDLQYLPPDKKRETETNIQILLIESLFQLCATKPCRLKLKNSGAYYILREFHKFVGDHDEGMQLPLENAIQILIGNEPEAGNENIREVEIPEYYQKHFKEQDIENAKNSQLAITN